MVELLAALTVVTGAAAVAGLGLALLALRRLRPLQQQLALMTMVDDLPGPGDPVPEFDAATTDGGRVGTADLAGPDVLVLFVDSSCPTCFDAVSTLRAMPAGDARPIAVVVGSAPERARMIAELQPLARVVEEPSHTGLPARFGVRGFPAALVAGSGVVRGASHRLDELELGTRV